MTERFREVEPIELDGQEIDVGCGRSGCEHAHVGELILTVPEARELRDWLTRALPEEPRA